MSFVGLFLTCMLVQFMFTLGTPSSLPLGSIGIALVIAWMASRELE